MTDAAKKLSEQARQLSPVERLELVDAILASVESPDPSMDRLWTQEAEERLSAYRRGEIKSVGLREVLAKYRVE
jgi:putative addiction module component (TIGR02574 family)